jgi:hypothetical protein
MEQAVIEHVLQEILQQQKEIGLQMGKDGEARQELFIKLEALEKQLAGIKVPPSPELSPTLLLVKNRVEELKSILEAQPKNVVHKKSFQLFPDRPVEYYKTIFGSVFKYLVILIVGIYSLVIINRYIRELEYLHYKQAWQYYYSIQREDTKQALDKIWNESR